MSHVLEKQLHVFNSLGRRKELLQRFTTITVSACMFAALRLMPPLHLGHAITYVHFDVRPLSAVAAI